MRFEVLKNMYEEKKTSDEWCAYTHIGTCMCMCVNIIEKQTFAKAEHAHHSFYYGFYLIYFSVINSNLAN